MGTARKLRVVQMVGSMDVGGQERVVARLARGLDPARFDVQVCCTHSLGVIAGELVADGIPVRLAAPSSHKLRYLAPYYVRQALLATQPDILHTHGTVSMLHVGSLSYLTRIPSWLHTFHYGNYAKAVGRMWKAEGVFCKRASRLVAVSNAQRRDIIKYHGVDPNSIVTVVNGVGPNPHLGDAALRARKRAEFGLDDRTPVIGTLAVMTEQKGLKYLLPAAQQVLARHPHARFLVVGGGPLEATLRAEADALGLAGRVIFTGWRTDNLEILASLDVFLMTSLWEAMPMALLEAMAARLAIVATDVGDNRGVLADGDCGLVIPPADSPAIAAALDTLLTRPDLTVELSRRAYDRFADEFTASHMLEQYERIYEELDGSERQRSRPISGVARLASR